jgi:hypothetical protein
MTVTESPLEDDARTDVPEPGEQLELDPKQADPEVAEAAGRPIASDTVEANEADLAEQLSELPEDEDEYR